MPGTAVRIEGLGKRYRVGSAAVRHASLRDAIAHAARAPFRNLRAIRGLGRTGAGDDVVWALRDVSLEVKHGEAVAIVGRNGAGKSTLLKILSRITEPSVGRVEVRGRVGSLLEVGTGFHPELSGRENVYLNGSILGMDRAYIERRFDEIVEFSGVARYIDTPVKRYSSGMYLRLAFAVAAHLEPEILVVDEVLAVGDAEFQKKCLGKMGEVSREGRTVLFVSHDMGAVNALCSRAIVLNQGGVEMSGPAPAAIAHYLAMGTDASGERSWPAGVGDGGLKLFAARVRGADGSVTSVVDTQRPFRVEMEYEVTGAPSSARIGFRLLSADGTVVFTSTDADGGAGAGTKHPGRYRCGATIPGNLLNEGKYWLTLAADIPFVTVIFFEESALAFRVERTGGAGASIDDGRLGVIRPTLAWDAAPLGPAG